MELEPELELLPPPPLQEKEAPLVCSQARVLSGSDWARRASGWSRRLAASLALPTAQGSVGERRGVSTPPLSPLLFRQRGCGCAVPPEEGGTAWATDEPPPPPPPPPAAAVVCCCCCLPPFMNGAQMLAALNSKARSSGAPGGPARPVGSPPNEKPPLPPPPLLPVLKGLVGLPPSVGRLGGGYASRPKAPL